MSLAEVGERLDRSRIPGIVFDKHPEYVELYYKAWELAAQHIYHNLDMPAPRYMGEGCNVGRVWIWDTCFMALFCKYAPGYFPGMESLDNFYCPIHDAAPTGCLIHHPDNPPLFAWLEYEYARFTGDTSRLKRVFQEKKYLQKHYEFLENMKYGTKYPFAFSAAKLQKADFGYYWSPCSSGMDNTPRGYDNASFIYWVDILAQQALSALNIAKIARLLGDRSQEERFLREYESKKALLNERYYDQNNGVYYDISERGACINDILTPASFWPLLAECASPNQAERQIAYAMTPERLGGKFPFPSVARDSVFFEPKGAYWRGGIWLPVVYMSIQAIRKYGFLDIAAECAENLVNLQYETYRRVEPHTIWECYCPTDYLPSTEKTGVWCRKDFCGWSALGPISLMIENVIGIYDIDGLNKTVSLHPRKQGRHGVTNLRFADVVTDIIIDDASISVKSNTPYTLCIDGKTQQVLPGDNSFSI